MLLLLAYMALFRSGENAGPLGMLKSLLLGVLLFTSIALHELGHSFVAIRKGCRVYEITLMFMGGAAKMSKMPENPRDEFLMAIAGPAVSLLIGVTTLTLGMLLGIIEFTKDTILLHGFFGWIFLYLGGANIILAIFNIIPAFPMDGGRVFRAMLTPKYGRIRATYMASRLGRAIAVLFFITGLFVLGSVNLPLIIIAIFIFTTADREYRMVQYEELMKQRNSSGGNNMWSSIFDNMYPPSQSRPQPPPPPPAKETEDDSVYISPPPYSDDPESHTDLHHTNEQKNNPFKGFFGR